MENFTLFANFLRDVVVDVRTPLWLIFFLEVSKIKSWRFRRKLRKQFIPMSPEKVSAQDILVRDLNGNFVGYRPEGHPDLLEFEAAGYYFEDQRGK